MNQCYSNLNIFCKVGLVLENALLVKHNSPKSDTKKEKNMSKLVFVK